MTFSEPAAPFSAAKAFGPTGPPAHSPVPALSIRTRRIAPNTAASVVVGVCFLCLFIGVIVFTSRADREQRNKPREPARNMPMIHLR
ncbi:MAG: hypothetical protein NTY53_08915 [Kiritimatiellaeota bacterium]|nr:hypothetical protein [Kiritimatiellota bacterium]